MNNLLKLRKEQGLTRPDLEKLSGVPASTIHKLELGVNDMKGAKADTLYKLAIALNTTVEHLLKYYLKPNIGTLYEEAELKCIVILQQEWDKLNWENTGIELLSDYNGNFVSTRYDVANALGYKIFAKMNTTDYCYIKDGELFVLRGHGSVTIAKLPKTANDVIENDGIICNGCYTSIKSLNELPQL